MYRYEGKRRRPDRDLWTTLRAGQRATPPADEVLQERVFGLMVNEAARCLDEGVVATAGDLDLALVFGIGFPPFRGGLLRHADAWGLAALVRRLEKLASEAGERFTPCSRLRRMAATGETFHPAR